MCPGSSPTSSELVRAIDELMKKSSTQTADEIAVSIDGSSEATLQDALLAYWNACR